MRKPVVMWSPFLATLALAPLALAATYYVSPTGTATTGCTKGTPCDLTSGVGLVAPGDTVILMDGTYKSQIDVKTSGTSSAWITFQADECATPIIEGVGVETDTGVDAVDQPTGVGSATATYIRYNGLISRHWNTGFGNGWTGNIANDSNGNVEYKYCIGDSNGRTGFTFYSAAGLHIQNCISAHNGSSAPHSWSSGITLYSASGTLLIEGTLSFENMDAEKHTDGSGFIVDESTNNATFLNNIAFGNGGSCFRLTKSSGTKFINNTCYHNSQDPQATGPTNPGELYFTDSPTSQGVSFMNNVVVATGVSPRGSTAVINQPTSGWTSNNVSTGSASFFTSPDGTNPDFTLSSSSALRGAGSSGSGVPSTDIGFNPKCITKRAPTMVGSYTRASWWNYSVDVDYIKSIGGVAKCFTPKSRSGTPDIGAYANGAVTTAAACVPTSTGGSSSTGGTKATGGASSTGGSVSAGGTASTGGSKASGGSTANAGTKATGGSSANTGTKPTGGSSSAAGGANAGGTSNANAGGANAGGGGANTGGANVNGGSSSASTGGSVAVAGNAGTPVGGSAANVGGGAPVGGVSGDTGGNVASAGASGAGTSSDSGGCGCRVAGSPARPGSLAALGLLGLAILRITRRRQSR